MKTIEEMLLNLARPEVVEFGLVSNRLPSINVGGKFEPVDTRAPSTDTVLQMLVTMGGSRYVESLSPRPTQWTTQLKGVGVVAIAAIMRDEVVQARFTVARREAPRSGGAIPAAPAVSPLAVTQPSAAPPVVAAAPPAPPPAPPPPAPPPPVPHPVVAAPPVPQASAVPPVGAFRAAASGVVRSVPPPVPRPAPPAPSPPLDDDFDDDDELTVQTMTPSTASGAPSEPAGPPTIQEPLPPEVPRPKPPRSPERPPSVTNIQAVPPVHVAPAPHPPAPVPPQEDDAPRPPSAVTAQVALPPVPPSAVQLAPLSLTTVHAFGPSPQPLPARRAAPADAPAARPAEAPWTDAAGVVVPANPPPPRMDAQERRVFSAKDTQRIPTPTRLIGMPGGVALANVGGAEAPAARGPVVVNPSEETSEADATDPTVDIVVASTRHVGEPAERPSRSPTSATKIGVGSPAPVPPGAPLVIAPPPASVTPLAGSPMSLPLSTDRAPGADGEMVSVVEHALIVGPAPPTDPTLLETHLFLARQLGASDLYLLSDRSPVFRVATDVMPRGVAVPADALARIVGDIVPARRATALERDGMCDFALQHALHGRFRVNVSRQRSGWKVALRMVSKDIPTLSSLGLPETLAGMAAQRRGLVLVTGPAGHGKTATVAALVDVINRVTSAHVLTLEAPIEHVHPRKRAIINQREIGTASQALARAADAATRADADVVVLGDLPDVAAVRAALHVAESGRLVLAALSAPSVAGAIVAMIDLAPRGEQAFVRAALASNLRLLIGQRLVPSANRTRVHAACEILPASPSLHALLRDGRTSDVGALQQRGKAVGALRLDESLADLARQGKVTLDMAKLYAETPAELDTLVAGDTRRDGSWSNPVPTR